MTRYVIQKRSPSTWSQDTWHDCASYSCYESLESALYVLDIDCWRLRDDPADTEFRAVKRIDTVVVVPKIRG